MSHKEQKVIKPFQKRWEERIKAFLALYTEKNEFADLSQEMPVQTELKNQCH